MKNKQGLGATHFLIGDWIKARSIVGFLLYGGLEYCFEAEYRGGGGGAQDGLKFDPDGVFWQLVLVWVIMIGDRGAVESRCPPELAEFFAEI